MNYFKSAEQDLSAIPDLRSSLSNLKKRRDRFLNSGCPSENVTIDYSKPYINSQSVNDTLSELVSLNQINKEIAVTESKIKELETILGQLDKTYREIIEMWYIDNRSKEYIAEQLHFEKRDSVYSRRNKAVAQFALLYYGASALNSI